MTVVLKLGGSVITEKDRPQTVDDAGLTAAADAIATAAIDRLVVVHGGGSFGHPAAASYGVTETAGTYDVEAIREIHGAMRQLSDAVVGRLADAGVPAVPIHPSSGAVRSADGSLTLATDVVEMVLDEGFVPVLHGDGVVTAGAGVTVLSGDEIVTSLAGTLGAERVGLCTTVPGVLDDGGDVIGRIEAFEDVAASVGQSEATDVTGGMAGKVRALLELSMPAHVFGLGELQAFLDGEEPGTRVG
ncbi:MAG: isopentenyl phosphate kinase [Halobacteriales archaeon]|nr:isopentenyl phosphate kinase [Halobacteriales archaeon]